MAFSDNNITLIIDSHYFGCVNYYINLVKHKKIKIERFEHYQKVSYRNRCYIAGPNGRILLSVPLVKGKNQRTVMKDVRIDNTQKWQSLHWKTLTSAYRRSPWFEYYEEELNPFFVRKYEFLLDWNMELFCHVNNWLGINIQLAFTEEYIEDFAYTEEIDCRNRFLPPPGNDPGSCPVSYRQVFEDRTGFLPNLSILDLLFCEGKRAGEILLG
jgi:WbqC-like protein family